MLHAVQSKMRIKEQEEDHRASQAERLAPKSKRRIGGRNRDYVKLASAPLATFT